ncbi:MAG: molybdopterin oxidoreductase family protein, partial [Leptospira sp.]|nr:molybdopterin oxidoreductase family protein [Leptospira sp.]
SVLQTIYQEKLVKDVPLFSFVDGIKELGELVSGFSPEKTEKLTGVAAETTRRIARDFSSAESAVCHGRVGLSTQEFGGLSQWLVYALNIVTGNLDRQGGAMFTLPAVDVIGMPRVGGSAEKKFDRYRTKARDLPEFDGEFPVAGLADEILFEGEGRIRAMVTSAGNPVLSTPNGNKLEKALETLEYMVCVDFYLNETTKHANIILPPTSALEHDHYDLVFNVFAVRNTTKYSQPVFEPEEGMLHDWEIFSELTNRLDHLQSGKGGSFPNKAKIKPTEFLDRSLKSGPYSESKNLNLELLQKNPHGIDLGPLKPVFPGRLHTPDKKIHLVPDCMRKDLERLARKKDVMEKEINGEKRNYYLIGRRHLRNNNSWMHNLPKLMTGKSRCTLLIHPSDAESLGVADEGKVIVRSRVGQVEIEAELSDEMMPGVVSIPHGFGHGKSGTQTKIANQFAGVSINDLTDEMALDELTGNAAFSGVPVSVESVAKLK